MIDKWSEANKYHCGGHHFPDVSGAEPKLEGRRLSGKWEKENKGNEKNLIGFEKYLKFENYWEKEGKEKILIKYLKNI